VREKSRLWEMPVTISAGVASFPADGGDEDALLRSAYAACDAAKRAGGDRAEAPPGRA
jgi:GGDEF domain-containing protein